MESCGCRPDEWNPPGGLGPARSQLQYPEEEKHPSCLPGGHGPAPGMPQPYPHPYHKQPWSAAPTPCDQDKMHRKGADLRQPGNRMRHLKSGCRPDNWKCRNTQSCGCRPSEKSWKTKACGCRPSKSMDIERRKGVECCQISIRERRGCRPPGHPENEHSRNIQNVLTATPLSPEHNPGAECCRISNRERRPKSGCQPDDWNCRNAQSC
eukprot:gene17482-biopygen9874